MKENRITVTEAARRFAYCLRRAHDQGETFILLKNGKAFARIVPDAEKRCTGAKLAAVLEAVQLSTEDAREWARDLKKARRCFTAPAKSSRRR